LVSADDDITVDAGFMAAALNMVSEAGFSILVCSLLVLPGCAIY
jgi:hypothetical protein